MKKNNQMVINAKEGLARAEQELIATRRAARGNEESPQLEIVTTNYEIAKRNLAMAERLAGIAPNKTGRPDKTSKQLEKGAVPKKTVANKKKQSTEVQPTPTRSQQAKEKQTVKPVTMTRQQYRQQLKKQAAEKDKWLLKKSQMHS